MKIFILEDNMDRIWWFRDVLKEHQLTIAFSYREAVYRFDRNAPYDVIFLDHDIEDMLHDDQPDIEFNGHEFAKWLVAHNHKFNQIFIHSANDDGAKNIYNEVHALSPIVEVMTFWKMKEYGLKIN